MQSRQRLSSRSLLTKKTRGSIGTSMFHRSKNTWNRLTRWISFTSMIRRRLLNGTGKTGACWIWCFLTLCKSSRVDTQLRLHTIARGLEPPKWTTRLLRQSSGVTKSRSSLTFRCGRLPTSSLTLIQAKECRLRRCHSARLRSPNLASRTGLRTTSLTILRSWLAKQTRNSSNKKKA